ncbi:MAG: hypothetical protein AAGD10_20925 [Myxococcota bacterium]
MAGEVKLSSITKFGPYSGLRSILSKQEAGPVTRSRNLPRFLPRAGQI